MFLTFVTSPLRLLYSYGSSRIVELLTGADNTAVTMKTAQSVVLRNAIAVFPVFAETNKPQA